MSYDFYLDQCFSDFFDDPVPIDYDLDGGLCDIALGQIDELEDQYFMDIAALKAEDKWLAEKEKHYES